MYCKKCGVKIPNESIFCFSCGSKVKEDAEQVNRLESLEKKETLEAERNFLIDDVIENKNVLLKSDKKLIGSRAVVVGLNSNISNAIRLFSFLSPIATLIYVSTKEFFVPFIVSFIVFQIFYLIVLVGLSLKICDGKGWLWFHFGFSLLTLIPILAFLDVSYYLKNYKKKKIDFEISIADLESAAHTNHFYTADYKPLLQDLFEPMDAKVTSDIYIEIGKTTYRRIAYLTSLGGSHYAFFLPSENKSKK